MKNEAKRKPVRLMGIPANIHERLKEDAQRDHRTIASQLAWTLEQYYSKPTDKHLGA